MPRNFSELKSGGDNSYAAPPPTLKSGGTRPSRPPPIDARAGVTALNVCRLHISLVFHPSNKTAKRTSIYASI